jgi:hypothetical protein
VPAVEHVVRFTTTEGRDAQHVTKTLEDALRFVERLRNNEEASVVRVFRMQEVPITFKTYYKVELRPGAAEDVADVPTPSEARSGEEPGSAGGKATPEGEQADGAGRKLFSRA